MVYSFGNSGDRQGFGGQDALRYLEEVRLLASSLTYRYFHRPRSPHQPLIAYVIVDTHLGLFMHCGILGMWRNFLVDEEDGAKTSRVAILDLRKFWMILVSVWQGIPTHQNVLNLNLGCRVYKGLEMTENQRRSLMLRWWTFTKFMCVSCARF